MIDNPWTPIARPSEPNSYSVRRSDPDHPFEFFWGRDYVQRCLFIMQFGQSSRNPRQNLPVVKGLELTEHLIPDMGRQQIVMALREQANNDLFYRLCCDLLDATRNCQDESTAVATTITRLWRWQQLMKQGRTDKLTEEEQKGLIGELVFLRDTLLPRFGPMEAISFWQGPMAGEGEKDFSVSNTAIEIKTRSGTAPPRVRISSEGQLDIGNYARLFLVVYELSRSSGEQPDSFNLDDLVKEVRVRLMDRQPESLDFFEGRLASWGYSDLHDYENDLFMLLGQSVFAVEETFPRLVPGSLPAGVHELKYTLNLIACQDYEIDSTALAAILEGER
jgi:hypothetical protein